MKNRGISDPEFQRMATQSLDRSLDPEALREIERGLRGKLRALPLSDSFIDRVVDDAVQKGLVEYLQKLEQGEAIENQIGFIVRAAYLRAIDELRREARQADGAVVDVLIDTGSVAEPPSDELAIEHLEVQELREAVRQLSPEEQQVLSLHYFEEKTTEASAQALFCSERTYRRRLKQALRKLGEMLDAPVPKPGSELAIEIGVVTWIALRGAKVPISSGPLEQLIRFAEGLVGRTGGGETGEKVVVATTNGTGRIVGGCVAALAACVFAVGGAELAGIGPGGGEQTERARPAPIERKQTKPDPVVIASPVPAPPQPRSSSSPTSRSSADSESAAAASRKKTSEANQEVETQGVGSLVPEDASSAPAESPPTETAPPSSGGESSPNGVVGSQGEGALLP